MKEVKKRGTGRIFWGIFFVLGAVLLIVSQLGMMEGIGFFTVMGTLFFVAILLKSLVALEFTGIFFSAAFLVIIYDEQLALEAITPWPVLGAALLLSIGCHMLFRRHRCFAYKYEYEHDGSGKEGEYDEVIDEKDGETIHFGTSFGSTIKYVNTDDFKRADLHCSFGALAVYFDNAMMQQEKAVINLDVSFAGVELYIPKTWTVVNKVTTSLGAIEEKNRSTPDGLHTVILNGKTSFSGVEITYI